MVSVNAYGCQVVHVKFDCSSESRRESYFTHSCPVYNLQWRIQDRTLGANAPTPPPAIEADLSKKLVNWFSNYFIITSSITVTYIGRGGARGAKAPLSSNVIKCIKKIDTL